MTDSAPFTCPFCDAVSHNPNDARERVCGRCHVFVDDVPRPQQLPECPRHPGWGCPGECQYILGPGECAHDLGLVRRQGERHA